MDDYVGLFHVDSNAIDDRCSNSASSFKNYTSSMYRYSSDKFEAGLLELHLPFSWINLHPGNYIGIFDQVTGHLVRNGIIYVREGYYPTLQSLIDECNLMVERNFYGQYLDEFFPPEKMEDGTVYQPRPPQFLTYEEVLRHAHWRLTTGRIGKASLSGPVDPALKTVRNMYVRFTPQLALLLGFDGHFFEHLKIQTPITEKEQTTLNLIKARVAQQYPYLRIKYELEFPEDLKRGDLTVRHRHHIIMYQSTLFDSADVGKMSFNTLALREPNVHPGLEELFIYCSIIKHHAIGNSFKQLLRVTPVNPPPGASRGLPIVLSYDRPYYFPLFDTSFDSIEIELRDRAGQLINFESGGTIAILEIRRRKDGE